MFNRKWLRKLTHRFSQKDFVYHDKVPQGFLKTELIPVYVFDNDILMVNCGLHEKYKDYLVLVRPLELKGSKDA